jgi:hypothetical protein
VNAVTETLTYQGPIFTQGHPPIIRNVPIAILTSPLKVGDIVQLDTNGNGKAWDTTSPVYGIMLEDCPISTSTQFGSILVHGCVREDAVLVAGVATMSPAVVHALRNVGIFVD